MTSFFSAEGNIVNYPPNSSPAIQCHDPSQLAAHQNTLGTPQYPDVIAYWHNSQQPHVSPPIQNQMAPAIPDQKKHKRTRSGCFTCRARRVKCDETHPVCDRCSKGNRECVYPSVSVRRSGSRANLKNDDKHPPIPESESSDENQGNDDGVLGSKLPGSDKGAREGLPNRQSVSAPRSSRGTISRRQSSQSLAKKKASRRPSESRSSAKEKSGSPLSDATGVTSDSHSSFGTFENIPSHPESSQALSDLPGAGGLKPDVRFFLAYRQQNVTFRHYFLKACAESFVRDDMAALALEYPPLLYATIGFAAYHYSVAHPNGRITTFLQYYNQSVSALLKSLRASERHSDAMLLTILQLAAFEEYLGDWLNLVDHHQAAHRMLLELYNPETIQQDNFRRHIFMWYSRFDVMAGLLAGNETILNRDWYMIAERNAVEDAAMNPGDLNRQLMKWGTRNRTYAMDMASLFARTQRGLVTMEEFMAENQKLETTINELRQQLDSMKDSKYVVTTYPNRVPLGPDDIVDPYVPGTICDGPLWEVNYCIIDLLGSKLMHRYQTSLVQQQTDVSELKDVALELCRVMETMCRWPGRPKDFAILLQSTLGIGSLFLPHDEKHIMWSRRKMAMIEQLGYIYPITLRTRMANLWRIPEVNDWWLPNNEGYPTLIREIREWTKERTTNPRDTFREALRDMKMMFWRMNIDDCSSQTTSPGSQSTGYPERTPEQTPP